MALIEAIITIPVADNVGVPFSDAAWLELHARLVAVAEGFTRRGPHLGFWIDPGDGREYREPVFEFESDIASWMNVGAFVEVAHWAAAFYHQRAILIKVAGVPEVIPAKNG